MKLASKHASSSSSPSSHRPPSSNSPDSDALLRSQVTLGLDDEIAPFSLLFQSPRLEDAYFTHLCSQVALPSNALTACALLAASAVFEFVWIAVRVRISTISLSLFACSALAFALKFSTLVLLLPLGMHGLERLDAYSGGRQEIHSIWKAQCQGLCALPSRWLAHSRSKRFLWTRYLFSLAPLALGLLLRVHELCESGMQAAAAASPVSGQPSGGGAGGAGGTSEGGDYSLHENLVFCVITLSLIVMQLSCNRLPHALAAVSPGLVRFVGHEVAGRVAAARTAAAAAAVEGEGASDSWRSGSSRSIVSSSRGIAGDKFMLVVLAMALNVFVRYHREQDERRKWVRGSSIRNWQQYLAFKDDAADQAAAMV